jgi:hypothetical protein
MAFGLTSPKKKSNLFGNCLKGIPKADLVYIRVGVCAVIWTLWNTRNDLIFNKLKKLSFLQVIYMVTYWIHM